MTPRLGSLPRSDHRRTFGGQGRGEERDRDLLNILRDARRRSLAKERKNPKLQVAPSKKNYPGVMVLLLKLHDTATPKTIGKALNLMNEKKAPHRINHVRYDRFDDLAKALATVIDDREKKKAGRAIFP